MPEHRHHERQSHKFKSIQERERQEEEIRAKELYEKHTVDASYKPKENRTETSSNFSFGDLRKSAEESKWDKFLDILLAREDLRTAHDNWGFTPLHLVCWLNGPLPIIQDLLSSDFIPPTKVAAIMNSGNRYGQTPLHLALANKVNKEIVSVLLNKGPDLSIANGFGQMAIHIAMKVKWSDDIVIRIISMTPDVTKKDKKGKSVFADDDQSARVMIALYDKVADKRHGESALHGAMRMKAHFSACCALVNAGHSLNKKNAYGKTPLDMCEDESIKTRLQNTYPSGEAECRCF